MRLNNAKPLDAVTVALSQNSAAVDMDHMAVADVTATFTDVTPAAKAFTAATTDVVTIANHGYPTGLKVAASSTDTLPGGLSATNYYWISLTASTGKLATSQANALAGTAVDITSAGTGTHTLTPASTLAGSVKLQKNSEPEGESAVWFDVASSSQTISAAGSLNWTLADIGFRQLRAVVAMTSGAVAASVRVNGKGA